MGDILSAFPPGFTPRGIQADILGEMGERLASGYKKIILCAPTGVGKSLIAAAVARHCERSFIVTASKQLQDQYSRDMGFLRPVKGKSNFPCLKLMEAKDVPSAAKAERMGLTCDRGQCVEKKEEDGKVVEETCPFKPRIKDIEKGDRDAGACHYYLQKYDALVSPHSLWNYAAYFQIIKYNQDMFAPYLNRRVAIFDEAHKIEDQITQFIGIDIHNRALRECGINMSPRDWDGMGIDAAISIADGMADYYAGRLKELEDGAGDASGRDSEVYARTEASYKRAIRAKIDMAEDTDNFVINRPETYGVDGFRVSIKPIDISKYVDGFFQTELQVFMSATIDRESFCENTGMDPKEVAIVDTPRSPFPAERRSVDFLDVRRLNNRSTEQDKLAVINKIDEIMTEHSGHRGLILTSSAYWCNDIRNGLSEGNRRRIRICHSRNADGRTQSDILDEHASIPNSVLLSSSLWEGVDLRDDLSRFQIIAKVPYPNLSEKRVREKMHRFPLWYDAQTLTRLLQGLGRSIRGDGDWAKTYVLDSAVHHVLSNARRRVPRAYHDVLGWN